MGKKARVTRFIEHLGELSQELPDNRAGHHNQQYSMGDAVRGAFSVFFTQSPSFLAHQRDMARRQGHSNAKSVFQMGSIPSDNHIRNLLDTVPAAHFASCYEELWNELDAVGEVSEYHVLDGRLLVGIDGIQLPGMNPGPSLQARFIASSVAGERKMGQFTTAIGR